MATLIAIIVFALLLSFLVFIHELGHFAVAKWTGMRVDEFAIGFPPRIWSKRRGETLYALNAIPFGGYVKIHGEGSDEHDTDPRSFENRPVLARILVILAGITMNTLFAFIALTIAFSVGFTSIGQDLASTNGATVLRHEVLVAGVIKDSPAEKAGIRAGDLVRGFQAEGQAEVEITSLMQLVDYTKALQQAENFNLSVRYDHEGIQRTAVTVINAEGPALGISIQSIDTVRVPFWQAPKVAITEMKAVLELTWDALANFGKKLFTKAELDQNVSGPIGIYQATATATQMGFAQVIFLAIVLSLNLALLNLLPIPALDGGKFLFLLIELIFRKRMIHRTVEQWMTTISFFLLILLMLILTARDIFKLF